MFILPIHFIISIIFPFLYFIFVRKTDPELTSVPIFLYFVYGMLPQCGLMSGVLVHIQDLSLQALGC